MPAKPVALVTGAAGFCGRHLVSHLLHSGYHVVGFDRNNWPEAGFTLQTGDITDSAQVRAMLRMVQPDVIFHLAGLTNPGLEYGELHRINVLGTLCLLNAVHEASPRATVLITSSSAVYGRVQSDALPISEEQPFHPVSFYAVSKVAQEMVAYQQFAQRGLRVIRTRAFNLNGPGESAHFVTSAFARQIAEIELGLRAPTIEVGNLDTVRDFTDVRDAVRAYSLLVDRGKPGEVYNVCSGLGTSVRRLLDILLDLGHARGISIQVDPSRMQPADVPIQVGDPTRLRLTTGWTSSVPLHQTIGDVLSLWKQRIGEGVSK